MPDARLIIKKRPRGEYEIGTFTADGAIVARVTVWDGTAPDDRTENERQSTALEQARRLVKVLDEALDRSVDEPSSWAERPR
jgi:hypothetical protein